MFCDWEEKIKRSNSINKPHIKCQVIYYIIFFFLCMRVFELRGSYDTKLNEIELIDARACMCKFNCDEKIIILLISIKINIIFFPLCNLKVHDNWNKEVQKKKQRRYILWTDGINDNFHKKNRFFWSCVSVFIWKSAIHSYSIPNYTQLTTQKSSSKYKCLTIGTKKNRTHTHKQLTKYFCGCCCFLCKVITNFFFVYHLAQPNSNIYIYSAKVTESTTKITSQNNKQKISRQKRKEK